MLKIVTIHVKLVLKNSLAILAQPTGNLTKLRNAIVCLTLMKKIKSVCLVTIPALHATQNSIV